MHEMIHRLGEWYLPLTTWYSQSLQTGGYPLIILLMAIESSLLPLPSELVIPPAAILASTHRGNLSLVGVVLAGAFGSWLGATVMYWASRWAGRPLVIKFGRFVLVSPEKVTEAERWSARFGSFGIFGSRLLPVIRHLIGIPSGIVRFNFAKYSLYTVAGSLLWCAVLCAVGVAAGNNEKLMNGDLKTATVWIVGAIACLGALYYFFVFRLTRAKA